MSETSDPRGKDFGWDNEGGSIGAEVEEELPICQSYDIKSC